MEMLLGDAEVVAAARRLRPEENVTDTLARVAWNVVAEPGDAVAGTLIGELGAADALGIAFGGSRQGTFALLDAAGSGSRALSEARKRWRPRADPRTVRDALRSAHDVGAALLIPGDPHWPHALDDLGANAPTVLWVRGRAELLVAEPRYW